MTLTTLPHTDIATSLGTIRLYGRWAPAPGQVASKPQLLIIGGTFAGADELTGIPEAIGILADVCIMRFPGDNTPPLRTFAVETVAAAVSELIATRFPGRPVVVAGLSLGAVAALGVRAPNLARVVAVEPPLDTGAIWPVVNPLRGVLDRTDDAAIRAVIFEAVGVFPDRIEPRDYRGVLEGLATPVDVLLGEQPLQPPRPLKTAPSLVSEADRRRLAASPRVRLHVAEGAGHNVLGEARKAVTELLLEACRRASASLTYAPGEVDEALLEATPVTARRVLYVGPEGHAFRAAFLAGAPKAGVWLEGETAQGDLDALVLAGPPTAEMLGRLGPTLAEGGHLIARWAEPTAAVSAILAPHGLKLRAPVDAGGTGVIRAQRLAAEAAPVQPIHVRTLIYSPLLMDIRTRLPARGLRSDPELELVYASPSEPPPMPVGRPKIMVMQRIAEIRPEVWASFMARAIRGGWVVVLEYDDHPLLIGEVMGKPTSEADMARLGFMHAIQTSTPPLIEAFTPYNPEVVMFPNAAFDLTPFPAGPRPKRVFYGAVIRGRYAVGVAQSLAPAIAAHPDAHFEVIGDRAVFDALPTTAKTYHPYMSYESYLGLMSECCVSLSPIEALPMRDTKSDAKYLDAARAGVLTIASPTIYDRAITSGVNGWLAPEVADWSPLLDRALADPAEREAMARRAWEDVRDHRMFSDQVAMRRDWYRDLWDRREALNAAVMGRLPGLKAMLGP